MPKGVRITLAVVLVSLLTPTVRGQLRVVNYNVAALRGDLTAMSSVLTAIVDDDVPGFAVAPHLYMFQEVQSEDLATLQMLLDETAPLGVTYEAGTYTNADKDGVAGAQAMFFRSDVLAENAGGHRDLFTGAGRNADRWELRLVGYDAPEATFYVYSAHLKASQGGANEQLRLDGVETIRENADALPAGTHVIYAGDFNFYGNDEPGYGAFFEPGTGEAVDPWGMGSWGGAGQSLKHTQSPRLNSSAELVGGGLDDRFDFQLFTIPFDDNAGLAYMTGTLRSLGNDGDHYNLSINDGNNHYYPGDVSRSNALADELHEASDHLPLIAEYQIPGMLTADLPADFGRAIQFGLVTVDLAVENAAAAIVPSGADLLMFTATGAGALSGTESGTLAPLAGPQVFSFAVDTALVGARTGSAVVTTSSEGAANPVVIPTTSGTIVRRSAPSFAEMRIQDATQIDWAVDVDSGTQTRDVLIHNVDFDVLQARLDVDSVIGAASPFAVPGPLPVDIDSDPGAITVTFDTNGVGPGVHHVDLIVGTSDEDLPGEMTDVLVLSIDVTVSGEPGQVGDIDGDGDVDFADLLELLSAWGSCPEPPVLCFADLDASGAVDFGDLLLLLSNWS